MLEGSLRSVDGLVDIVSSGGLDSRNFLLSPGRISLINALTKTLDSRRVYGSDCLVTRRVDELIVDEEARRLLILAAVWRVEGDCRRRHCAGLLFCSAVCVDYVCKDVLVRATLAVAAVVSCVFLILMINQL